MARWLTFRTHSRQEFERAPEQRDLTSSHIPSWAEMSGGSTYSGVNVTQAAAVGLPAVGAAVRLLSEMIAMMPLNVYRGRGADKRLNTNTWQYRLLAEMPGMGDFTPFDLISDIVGCLECNGNAYLQKVKGGTPPEVIALIVIDPAKVRVSRENGEKTFWVRNNQGREDRYNAGTILHIRGFTTAGSDVGLSPISVHRQKLGAALAQDEFQGRFFGQGTSGDIAVTLQGRMDEDEEERFYKRWRKHRAGNSNAHLPLVFSDRVREVTKLGMSLADSQFVEGERMNLIQIANIFRIPASFVGASEGSDKAFEQDLLRLYVVCVAPRLRRIESALLMDADLFPQRLDYPEFDTRPLLRTDAKTRAEVDHIQIQDGSRLVDEVRADRGEAPLPPMPDDPMQEPGKIPQITPVGGAPTGGGGATLDEAERFGLAAQRIGLATTYGLLSAEEGREVLGLSGPPPEQPPPALDAAGKVAPAPPTPPAK